MTRMYYFMLQLSVADIITAVFTMLPEVLWTLFGLPVLAPGKYRQGFHTEFVLIPSNLVETRAIVISATGFTAETSSAKV